MNNTQEKRFVSLRSDTTFKYLFKTDFGKSWFSKIILGTTGINLNGYELYDNELNSGNKKKDYRLDLLLKNKDNNYIIIEMNGSSKSQMIKARYYLYRVAGKKFNEGEEYQNTKNVLIAFNNFYNDKIKSLKTANYTLVDKVSNLEIEDIDIHEIYLPNYYKICYDKCNEIEKKLWLFNCESFKEMKELNLSDEDKAIVEELERLSMDDVFYDDYDAEKVNKMLMRSEFNDGFDQGAQKEKIEIAKQAFKMDMSIEDIQKLTSLSLEELEKIKSEM